VKWCNCEVLQGEMRVGAVHAEYAVITGAASGLGLAFAKILKRECNLVLIDQKAVPPFADGTDTGRVEAVVGDVENPETWQRARERLRGHSPKWLVQCAGIAVTGAIGEAPLEYWRRAIGVNFLGTVLGCRTFVPDMLKESGGYVVNIASRAAISGVPHFGPYAASKAAVLALSETLHNEVGDRISVTVACPSYFRSNLEDCMLASREVERQILHRRIENASRTAEQMAGAILEAARGGHLYFFPPGEDRRYWLEKRCMPVRALHSIRNRFRAALEGSNRPMERER